MAIDLIILLISIICLLISADKLIDIAVYLAEKLNISTMVIGLTIVAIGTSLPEAAASVAAALEGYPEIALGNVIGSNICNVALILGVPSLLGPIVCARSVLRREGFFMIGLTALLWLLALAIGYIPRELGILFVALFFFYVFFVFHMAKSEENKDVSEVEKGHQPEAIRAVEEEGLGIHKSADGEAAKENPVSVLIAKLVVSIIVLLLSSKFLVESTISLARGMGVSESVIALSVIALGTSLPELSVSIAAVRRKQGDILVGNILGSNISNILLVTGLASAISPISIKSITTSLDLPLMLVVSCFMIVFLWDKKGITKPRGVFLLMVYALVIARCICYPH